MDKKVERIHFTTDTGTSQEFISHDVNLQQFEFREKRGVLYEGYLLAVFDKAGDVIAMKCSKLTFEKNANAVLDAEKGTVFSDDFEAIGQKKGDPGTRKKGEKHEDQKPRKRYFRTF